MTDAEQAGRDPVLARLRDDAREIFTAALQAADPERCVERRLRRDGDVLHAGGEAFDLGAFRRVLAVGAGKASPRMARALERILGDRLDGGFLVTRYGHAVELSRIELGEAGHPVPDEAGLQAAERLLALAREADEQTLLIGLFSGGGSALLPAPAAGITLAEKQATTRLLLAGGAEIAEINAVRKHLSRIKGGGLARAAFPATVVSLLLSDVIGDGVEVIASGPTAGDGSTFADCLDILRNYDLEPRVPDAVRRRLHDGAAGRLPETPAPGDPALARCRNLVVGSNRLALTAAGERAAALGYSPLLLSARISGEAQQVGRVLAALALEAGQSGHPVKPPACLLAGGETTVTVRGDGLGGRCQELGLAAARVLAGQPCTVLLAAGTDGSDGPTTAAGALIDGSTTARARACGLTPAEHLRRNDSHPLLAATGDLLVTGPTGTNVMDVMLALVGRTRRG